MRLFQSRLFPNNLASPIPPAPNPPMIDQYANQGMPGSTIIPPLDTSFYRAIGVQGPRPSRQHRPSLNRDTSPVVPHGPHKVRAYLPQDNVFSAALLQCMASGVENLTEEQRSMLESNGVMVYDNHGL